MVRKYVFVRMPEDIYKLYRGIKVKMEKDIQGVTGRRIPLTMPKVFRAIASPKINENFIQIDIKTLVEMAKQKRRRYE